MDKQTLRMQFLSGIISESEYKSKLKENPEILEPEVKPDTDTDIDTKPSVPKRRRLTKPNTSPKTKPKAMFTEGEKNILDKITARFISIKNDQHS
jgi:hypothetical protein